MDEKMKAVYKRAKNDSEFLASIKSADNDDPPGMLASEITKAVFSAVYYGYCVGKYGDDWDRH